MKKKNLPPFQTIIILRIMNTDAGVKGWNKKKSNENATTPNGKQDIYMKRMMQK